MAGTDLVQRLRQRKLVQWTLAYLSGAFVVVQGLEVLSQAWSISVVLTRTVHILLLLGLALTLVLAWYHGEKGRQRASGPELFLISILLLVAGGVLRVAARPRPQQAARQEPGGGWVSSPARGSGTIRTMTVLPVALAQPDSASAILGEALVLALHTHLARLRGIEIRGRSSADRYRKTQTSDAEVARELGVDGVLRLNLFRHGPDMQVYGQLFDATGRLVWASRYDYRSKDMLALAGNVAGDVAQGIRVTLTSDERRKLAAAPTISQQAYEEYAWGHLFWTQRGDGLRRGLQHFRRAIELDSGFADAWAGVADSYNMLGFYNLMPPTQAFPQGRAAAEIALRLDPSNARAHTAMGAIHFWYDLDHQAALREFAAALQADPQYWLAYAWRGPLLHVLGREQEGITSGRAAIEGDRYYPIVHMAFGWRDYIAGDYPQAAQRFGRILDLTPGSAIGRRLLAQALAEQHRYAEAERELRQAATQPAHPASVEAQLAYVLGKSGRADSARAILDALERRYRSQTGDTVIQVYVSAYDLAVGYSGLNRPEAVYTWLDRAFDEKAAELFLFPLEPRFLHLRGQPRFRALIDRYWRAAATR